MTKFKVVIWTTSPQCSYPWGWRVEIPRNWWRWPLMVAEGFAYSQLQAKTTAESTCNHYREPNRYSYIVEQ